MSSPVNQASTVIDWATLMTKPVIYIDPVRLAACFNGRIAAPLCERLRRAPRLQGRLTDVITRVYALEAPVNQDVLSPVDQKVALLPAEQVGDLIRRAGAVYWANAIANTLRAGEVRQLREKLGEPVYTFALTNRNLSGSPVSFRGADTEDIGALIVDDGMRCLGAWCRSQPRPIATRVRMKMPPSALLDGLAQLPFDEVGPAIIRCAVM